jgi:exosome complex RNA-binding protein Csl4
MGAENGVKTPGDALGRASEYASGRGTYVRGDYVCASIVGQQKILPSAGAQVW